MSYKIKQKYQLTSLSRAKSFLVLLGSLVTTPQCFPYFIVFQNPLKNASSDKTKRRKTSMENVIFPACSELESGLLDVLYNPKKSHFYTFFHEKTAITSAIFIT